MRAINQNKFWKKINLFCSEQSVMKESFQTGKEVGGGGVLFRGWGKILQTISTKRKIALKPQPRPRKPTLIESDGQRCIIYFICSVVIKEIPWRESQQHKLSKW